jgi:hypothetical protein
VCSDTSKKQCSGFEGKRKKQPVQTQADVSSNLMGISDGVTTSFESRCGFSLGNVQIFYNSNNPRQFGTQILESGFKIPRSNPSTFGVPLHLSMATVALSKRSHLIQPRLEIGEVNDPLECEAERVAQQVIASSPSYVPIQIRRFAGGNNTSLLQSAPPSVERTLTRSGQPLEPIVCQNMEQHFGQDFSHVRIHTDQNANASARDINAQAYTAGSQIVFAIGKYSPNTLNGQHLLAHELAHVIQQANTPQQVQRWDAHEHVAIGDKTPGQKILLDCHNDITMPHTSNIEKWPQKWIAYYNRVNGDQKRALREGLTYGEISALAGDIYKNFDAINRAPLIEVIDLIPLIHRSTTSTTQFEKTTGGRYLKLAENNADHFSVNLPGKATNRDVWKLNHIKAIEAAKKGNANYAWGINAAADHFLMDAFCSGHIRVNKGALQSKKLDQIKAKVLHDIDNTQGVRVKNKFGEWTAYGEGGYLDLAKNDVNRRFMEVAIIRSKEDITKALAAFKQGIDYKIPTVFESEQYIPTPVVGTGVTSIWNSLKKYLRYNATYGMVVVQQGPGVIAEAFYRADDDVREWINKIAVMQPSALARQSVEDISRMINTLLKGWDSKEDWQAIEQLLDNITAEKRRNLDRYIQYDTLKFRNKSTALQLWIQKGVKPDFLHDEVSTLF